MPTSMTKRWTIPRVVKDVKEVKTSPTGWWQYKLGEPLGEQFGVSMKAERLRVL